MELAIFQVDTFTNELFRGSATPVVVLPGCLDPEDGLMGWLPDNLMMKVSMENNLGETAFVMADANRPATFHIRWFAPEREIDLCGHGTMGASHVLFTYYLDPQISTIRFISHITGELVIQKMTDGFNRYQMVFPSRMPLPLEEVPSLVLEAIGKKPLQVFKHRDYVLVYEREEDVANLQPNEVLLKSMGMGGGGIICTAKSSSPNDYDFVSRYFNLGCRQVEDQATGSAHCSLVPFWSMLLNKKDLLAKQISQRLGTFFCQDLGNFVAMSGDNRTYLKGIIWVESSVDDISRGLIEE